MRTRLRCLLAVLKAAALAAAVQTIFAASVFAADPPVRILFIGNSLTYTNDLPAMVKAIGAIHRRRIVTETVAFPNFSLADHLADGRAASALRDGPWDFVVLQQGPSALESSRRELVRDTEKFARLVGANGPELALLGVWPSLDRRGDFARVGESYRHAALAVNGRSIPAGEAWRYILARSRIALYGSDGFHPSPTGTFVAAMSVYRTLIGPLPAQIAHNEGADSIARHRLGLTDLELQMLVTSVEPPATPLEP